MISRVTFQVNVHNINIENNEKKEPQKEPKWVFSLDLLLVSWTNAGSVLKERPDLFPSDSFG